MKKSFFAQTAAVIAFAFASLTAPSAQASVLVGAATLNTSGDLTVVADGQNAYQFLDLSVTRGMSQASALSLYGASGFALASSNDLTRLFGAFGFSYFSNGALSPLTVTADQANSFISYLGTTFSNESLGSYYDVSHGQSYTCISVSKCLYGSFVYTRNLSSGNSSVGVYLVRAGAPTNVPEPGSIALLGLGLAGFAVARRAKK